MIRDVTKRQKKVLDVIIKQTIKQQRILTNRDVAKILNITAKGAFDHINALRKKGFIYNADDKAGIYPVGIKIVRIDE